MSLIPKISIGLDRSRNTFSLDQDTHTTAEIGYIQPTFCRTIVPGSSMNISSRSVIRLSPLAVPTMGRLALKNYYYFVDMSTLWTPFDSLREGSVYTYSDGTIATPYQAPYFNLQEMFRDLVALKTSVLDNFARHLRESIICTVYVNGAKASSAGQPLQQLKSQYGAQFNSPIPFYPYVYSQNSNGKCGIKSSETDTTIGLATSDNIVHPNITNKDADFCLTGVNGNGDTIQLLCKFEGPMKRLRKIFLGCGYSFNPFDIVPVTPFKLFAVYKAWFDTFAVQREMNWYHTACYRLIKILSDTYPVETTYGSNIFGGNYNDSSRGLNAANLMQEFLGRLADICYNLPADYFSASDRTAQRGANFGLYGTTELKSNYFINEYNTNQITQVKSDLNHSPYESGSTTAMGQKMAQVMLKFINKRSVVGRKIADLLKLNGETDLHNNEHESVHHLGDDKVDINISDVMSLAHTNEAALGDYAGRGVGIGSDDSFQYDTKAYGILLCLSAVVPQSGYFQGILRENYDYQRFDFFTDEFDALGYQTIQVNELVADNQFASRPNDDQVGTGTGTFGLTPRYQHLKVGRNIVNGDMSLPSLQDQMLPYTLDRHFTTRVPIDSSTSLFAPVNLPTNSAETFRQIRANDAYGDYNRIFQYTGSDYDHFIIQMVFDAKVTSPMKSISNSYDTFDDTQDNSTIEVSHE